MSRSTVKIMLVESQFAKNWLRLPNPIGLAIDALGYCCFETMWWADGLPRIQVGQDSSRSLLEPLAIAQPSAFPCIGNKAKNYTMFWHALSISSLLRQCPGYCQHMKVQSCASPLPFISWYDPSNRIAVRKTHPLDSLLAGLQGYSWWLWRDLKNLHLWGQIRRLEQLGWPPPLKPEYFIWKLSNSHAIDHLTSSLWNLELWFSGHFLSSASDPIGKSVVCYSKTSSICCLDALSLAKVCLESHPSLFLPSLLLTI